MTLRPDVLAAILAMAAATFLCRAGGYAILRAARPPPFVEAMLRALPGPLFVAYVAPAVLGGGAATALGALATVLAQWRTGQLVLSIPAGVAAVALARWAGL